MTAPVKPTLPSQTRIAEVALTVGDAGVLGDFYASTLGLEVIDCDADGVVLGVGREGRLRLVQRRGAERQSGAVGLYHFAVLFPDRASLAGALACFTDHGGTLTGAADHLVSEALYLDDPEGNGVELYRDRPREAWPRQGSEVRMGTLPLDLAPLREATGGSAGGVPPDTRIGHVHLQVHDIEAAEGFYRDVAGFDLMQRFGSSASFLGAGGYHHHVGINTWGTVGAAPALPDSLGLRWFSIAVPRRVDLDAVAERLRSAGGKIDEGDGTLDVYDPSGHRVRFRVESAAGESGAAP